MYYKTTEVSAYKEKSPQWTQNSKSPRLLPLKLQQAPGVYSYSLNDKINSEKPRILAVCFDKSPKETMVTKMANKTKNFPTVGSYDPSRADKVLSYGTKKSYK